MAPSRKRPNPPRSSSEVPKIHKKGKNATEKEAQKASVTKELTKNGFSKTKRPSYSIGLKLLLTDSIYETKVPNEVKGHLFLYEISEIHENGKTVELRYLEQVIARDGDKFRVYKDTEDAQVSYECYF